MKTLRWLLPISFIAVVLAGYVPRLIHAEAIALTDANKKDRTTAEKLGFAPPSTWTEDKWTGSDLPFINIRVAIDKIFQENRFSRPVLDEYREQARLNPKDPVAQFRWGYAYAKASDDGVSFGTILENQQTMLDTAWGLQQAPSPHCYEYTRLLYLISSMNSVPFLNPVGKRLLQHTPKDYDVEFFYYRGLAASSTPEGRKIALLGAQKFISEYPGRGRPYGALAEVYSAQWEQGDFQSGPLAVAAYRKYLSMPPKGLTQQQREGLEYWINFIRTHPSGPKGPKSN